MAAACNCLPILGDFCPSNEMDVGLLLSPSREAYIGLVIPDLINKWGLHNAYGNFTYSEDPRFYDYDVITYAKLMRDVYDNWENKYSKIDTRIPLTTEKWTWENSAQKLVEALS
jgi:hypothetical protein